jgi:hypothetical protein
MPSKEHEKGRKHASGSGVKLTVQFFAPFRVFRGQNLKVL